ncbi:hypothetical protein AZH53_04170 [Methanomicrobiaceae archaeon CYW5]|uniref:hypothetical protein n=1 Tax=Methanovulcanius yangii TaxID=1789227 RepID=UPI0029C9BAF6|nr:hypothetical protein [Methanovulcanius yangii]MBT8507614.1 hypothetical protein [Methanovulcanius yangii]
MKISDLRALVPADHTLRDHQQRNLSALLDISRSFARSAGLKESTTNSVQDDTVVLESGHQPNYFPYTGVWKKVYLLETFREMLDADGMSVVAYFGFADQNTTTAPFLYKNQVPALNKYGRQKIGFSVKGPDKWRRFENIPKPPLEVWEEEMRRLENLYPRMKTNHPEIMEIMWDGYERADSFSDLNAYIFSRISQDILECDVIFFRYSAISRAQLFSDECTRILRNLDTYTEVYNAAIKKLRLPSRPVLSGEVPFWYHCDCGGNIPLMTNAPGMCRGICPICTREFELDFAPDFSRFESYAYRMSLSAVSRNLIFPEAFGTHIFIPGRGGGVRYGKISDEIAHALGFHQPSTCSWSSKDYYLGSVHTKSLRELQKAFSLSNNDLLDAHLKERIDAVQEERRRALKETEDAGADMATLRLLRGRLIGSAVTADMAAGVFATVPSMFDLFMNRSGTEIAQRWSIELQVSVPERSTGRSCVIDGDVVFDGEEEAGFSREDIPILYRNLTAIGGIGT